MQISYIHAYFLHLMFFTLVHKCHSVNKWLIAIISDRINIIYETKVSSLGDKDHEDIIKASHI